MPKVNNIFFGFLLGLVLSGTTFGALYTINNWIISWQELHQLLSLRLLMTISLAVNILPFHYYERRKAWLTVRGILLLVFAGAGFMVYRFYWGQVF